MLSREGSEWRKRLGLVTNVMGGLRTARGIEIEYRNKTDKLEP